MREWILYYSHNNGVEVTVWVELAEKGGLDEHFAVKLDQRRQTPDAETVECMDIWHRLLMRSTSASSCLGLVRYNLVGA